VGEQLIRSTKGVKNPRVDDSLGRTSGGIGKKWPEIKKKKKKGSVLKVSHLDSQLREKSGWRTPIWGMECMGNKTW